MTDYWYRLLAAAVESDPRGCAGVADVLGVSRPAVSLVMRGKYPAGTARIARAVIDHYDHPNCPLAGRVIRRELCRKTALRTEPRGGDARARWLTCQGCVSRPAPNKGDHDA